MESRPEQSPNVTGYGVLRRVVSSLLIEVQQVSRLQRFRKTNQITVDVVFNKELREIGNLL